MTIQDLYNKLKRVEDKICCKTRFYSSLDDFPTVGKVDTLYIDKTNFNIYIWDTDTEQYQLLNQ